MHFIVRPQFGAEPLVFGTDRGVVRASIGPVTPITQAIEPENDFYQKLGFILGYDQHNKLDFVEIFIPSTVQFDNIMLLNEPLSRVISLFTEMGHVPAAIHGMYRFDSLGISIYCPQQTIESVSVFKAGYYNR